MKKITVALIGAGQRGFNYAEYALQNPYEMQIAAVAEPTAARRESFRERHRLPEDRVFAHWDELFAGPKLADAVMICTQDQQHFEPTMKALEAGYHVLLEKPMSSSPEECLAMGDMAARMNRVFSICHVLRYTNFFSTIKGLLDQGKIGKLMSITHNENVGYWHQAHSFVRGNWRRKDESSPMILAKSCHDLDILLWLAGADCTRVSSFGGDWGLMRDFLRLVQADGGQQGLTSADRSVQSHMIAFAAEQSRVAGKTLELAEFVRGLRSCSAG